MVRVQKKNIGEKCTFDARHVISECLVNNANNAITKSDGGGAGERTVYEHAVIKDY